MKSLIEKKIRKRLFEMELSVSELAKRMGVSRVALYHLFKGNYSREMLKRVSKEISMPIHLLLAPDEGSANVSASDLFRAYQSSTSQIQKAVDILLATKNILRSDNRPIVVVVDDLQENIDMLGRILRKNYVVLGFTDPRLALETIRRRDDVEAIISDQKMPSMLGTELLAEIEAMGRRIAKLMVSAYSDNEVFLKAINQSKANAFFVKPIRPDELRERLGQLLN